MSVALAVPVVPGVLDLRVLPGRMSSSGSADMLRLRAINRAPSRYC
jgi:hypothetical protein